MLPEGDNPTAPEPDTGETTPYAPLRHLQMALRQIEAELEADDHLCDRLDRLRPEVARLVSLIEEVRDPTRNEREVRPTYACVAQWIRLHLIPVAKAHGVDLVFEMDSWLDLLPPPGLLGALLERVRVALAADYGDARLELKIHQRHGLVVIELLETSGEAVCAMLQQEACPITPRPDGGARAPLWLRLAQSLGGTVTWRRHNGQTGLHISYPVDLEDEHDPTRHAVANSTPPRIGPDRRRAG
ncbi:MAG: hypothetical protein ACF8PN_06965 [Phycisphaerales bacterium]